MKAALVLHDGTVYRGLSVGADGTAFGEVVFNTSLTGYQEVLTDPSYHGQLVCMTYPHQGNTGLNADDAEHDRPWVKGFIMREATHRPSNWRSEISLSDYLNRHSIVGISNIDTRALVRHIRLDGAMPAAITTDLTDLDSVVDQIREAPSIVGRDLVREVTPAEAYELNHAELMDSGVLDPSVDQADPRAVGRRVAAIDYGMKRNISRCLSGLGFDVKVFRADATADDVLAYAPDGVFLSNGPGDPAALGYAVEAVRGILDKGIPTFGICLGNQLLATALGASTYKLKFGHRGGNHPVKCLQSSKVEITTQNHGFCVKTPVDPGGEDDAWKRIAGTGPDDWVFATDFGDVEVSHLNLNDGTVEGLRCRELKAFSVQYHPEAAPGPHDSRYLFADFVDMIAGGS